MLGCAKDDAKLHVFAAASLTDVLPKVGETWSDGAMPIEYVFDGTSRLAAQIESGAPADVFFAADREWMDTLDAKGFVLADTRHDLLGNRLVVVVPSDATDPPTDIEGLRSIGRLALAGASVPAGKYARAAIASLGLDLDAKIVEGDNVRTALAWVGKGEADAAIVYATDAKIEPKVKVVLELPAASHPPIVYPIAALAKGAHTDAALRFIAHLRSAQGEAIFREAGFAPPP